MRCLFAVATLSMLAASPVFASRVAIEVVDPAGKPIPDAVVTLAPNAGTPSRTTVPETRYVDQKDETFIPYVTALRVGDRVVFRNSDITRHHVYSFSALEKFEYMLAPGESSAPLEMKHAGNAAVGCNIHDYMLTYLYVTKDPEMAVTDAKGRATLDGLAAGQYTAHAWHPQLRPGITLPIQGVTLVEGTPGTLRFVLALLPNPRGPMDREHIGY
ncbi:methylamine utilization protein [Luteibacter pinisoli]|uniref:Methylamine utilization protein n=1 Tax=Luteibacter pinisoli TaxID=2589080 RepID=A0A4Y5Z1P2_9GAMM|nr:carboxypeptidase regulatory-like domain-containing protein [Luteibacter pinisoli]QDE38333.1 methylamine utilization protein [Luteibacter pinisoli]